MLRLITHRQEVILHQAEAQHQVWKEVAPPLHQHHQEVTLHQAEVLQAVLLQKAVHLRQVEATVQGDKKFNDYVLYKPIFL